MGTYGATLTITKKKGTIAEADNALFKKVLGILDTDEFEDVNGEPFSLNIEAVAGTDNQYQIRLTSYPGSATDESFKAAKDNDWELAKEIKDVLASTLGDHFTFKVVFE